MKSTSRCSKGSEPFTWIPGGLCLCREAALTCEQTVQFWDFVLHREERQGTKKYFQISSSNLSWPRWVAWCVWLTRVGASSSSTNNLPLGNSYHPFSVLMAPSALAGWFWASVYFGESNVSSGSSANMRALIGASLVTPKPSAADLVVLSASLFPEPGGYPLFDVLSSVWLQPFLVPRQHLIGS